MSLIFGGGQKQKPQYSSLQVQTSSNNMPVPIAGGQCRLAPNLIGWWDFQSHKQKPQGGKGGGGKGGSQYTYSAAVAMALCQGESDGVIRVFRDNEKNATLSQLNLVFFSGSDPQTPWSYLTTNHPADALAYPGIVYLASPKYDLGNSASLPQHSFETKALFWGTAVNGIDADVALFTQEWMTAPVWGVGFPSSQIDTDTLLSGPDAGTTGDAAMQTYCTAMGFGMSPAWSSQEEGLTTLKRICDIFNTAPVFNGDMLKFVPYALDTITANGVTYLPVTDSIYTLDDDHYVSGGGPDGEGTDPVIVSRRDPADIKNRLQMEILNRDKEYNAVPIEWVDQGLIDQVAAVNGGNGDRPDSSFTAHEVCDPEMATICVSLMGQRNAFRGNNKFKLLCSPALVLAEPMDLLTVIDPQMGAVQVQIDTVSEDDEYNLSFECSQVLFGSTDSTGFSAPDQTPTGNDTGIDPGSVNPPILFEPPSSLAGAAEVWAAVSGVDTANWGGCFVWVSSDDTSFTKIGEQPGPSRMGKTTSALAAYGGANPDTVHSVGVDLSMSAGELVSVTATDAANGVSLSYLGGELLSFRDADLTSTYHYDLEGQLYRGLYGTAPGAHLTNVDYARLDDAIFKYALPPQYIGQTLYFKFQSYNIFGGAVQDLSACTSYPFTPDGDGFGTGTGGVPAAPTGVSTASGAGFVKVVWTANSVNDNVDHYDIYRAAGPGGSFGAAIKIGNSSSTTYTDTTGVPATTYTYFVVAVNAIGPSSASAGADGTPTNPNIGSQPYGFAFGPKTPVASKILAVFDTPLAWTMPASLTDSQGSIVDSDTATAVAPSAQTDFDIQSPLGSSIATMRFAASSLTATFINTVGDSVPIGQPVFIISPANLNGIAGAIGGSVLGTRP